MMTRIYKSFTRFFLAVTLLIFSTSLYAGDNWIIGAQQFVNVRGKNDSVTEGITAMFPSRILEKLSNNLYRTVSSEEELYSQIMSLKTERTSLFLQFSSEIKKRDSLVTYNYSQKELDKKLKDADSKIQDIKKKIDENLQKQKEIEDNLSKGITETSSSNKNFFSNFIDTVKGGAKQESNLKKVSLYKNDFSVLFVPTELAKTSGYESSIYENNVVSSGLNGVITGKITLYGEYYSLTVELYLYPGCKKAATVTEVGSLNQADLVSSLIARELSPAISNSLPVKINLTVEPAELVKKTIIYVDSEIIKNGEKGFTLESGVHQIQFSSDGYNTVSTVYGFQGNRTYDVKVKFEPSSEKTLTIQLPESVFGDVILRGNKSSLNEANQTSITINDTQLLGIVISDKNEKGFFVVPSNLSQKSEALQLNLKSFDRSQYIEKRRRRMYTSYSILMTSLIPTFFTLGQSNIYVTAYNNGYLKQDGYAQMQAWQISSNVCAGISAACGVWFIYELVRYLYAANSVLPVEAKTLDINLLRELPVPSENDINLESENNDISEAE